ncbi:MAG: hypothetical protein WBQ18_08600 [Solirubrobacteraceae bacterium]
MSSNVSPNDPRIGVIAETLERFAWRRFSVDAVARQIVGALDRHWLDQELASICGVPRAPSPIHPADPGDERVGVVVEALRRCLWRDLTAAAVGSQAVCALESWREQRNWLDIELGWLLDDTA